MAAETPFGVSAKFIKNNQRIKIMLNNQPIGVFDSGVGGLTVLETLVKVLPNESFYYVADQGHCPYGPKPLYYVENRVVTIAKHMQAIGCKAVVIACNTASLHIKSAQKAVNIPVISVIQPTAKRALVLTQNKKVLVLATQATVNSGVYADILKEGGATVEQVACGSFVDFAENYDISDPIGHEIVKERLETVKDFDCDTLIHGCTHFSLLEPFIKAYLGDKNFIACGEPTSRALETILSENNLLCLQKTPFSGNIDIFTTGDVSKAESAMKWFKAEHNQVKHIDIE